jgi:hypothetical protein
MGWSLSAGSMTAAGVPAPAGLPALHLLPLDRGCVSLEAAATCCKRVECSSSLVMVAKRVETSSFQSKVLPLMRTLQGVPKSAMLATKMSRHVTCVGP